MSAPQLPDPPKEKTLHELDVDEFRYSFKFKDGEKEKETFEFLIWRKALEYERARVSRDKRDKDALSLQRNILIQQSQIL